ncbi:hypothetical protein BGZ73_006403 [Actinomortierella ambigua]|nr:hypothetical protein BGZ73_006403 [Actinomortierella ambigua]
MGTPTPPPYTVRCFSPLDFPPELFLYFIKFLSPSDLWRLCQVSRTMQVAILESLLPLQAATLNVVRTLHQESGDSSIDECHPGRAWFEQMTLSPTIPAASYDPLALPRQTHPIESPTFPHLQQRASRPTLHRSGGPSSMTLFTAIPGRPKVQGQVQRRSDYWKTQAKRLVAIVAATRDHNSRACSSDEQRRGGLRRATMPRDLSMLGGVPLAPIKPLVGSMLHTNNNASYHNSNVAHGFTSIHHLDHTTNNSHAYLGTALSQQQQHQQQYISAMQSSSSSSVSSNPALPPRPPLSPLVPHVAKTTATTAPTTNKDSKDVGISRDRLMILVDMIFDPHLVALEHRRAIINCARYVSAEVDLVHKPTIDLLKQTDPNHPLLRREEACVYLGPYLTIVRPPTQPSDLYEGWATFLDAAGPITVTEGEAHLHEMAQEGEEVTKITDEKYWLTHVEPPTRLRSFFQRMLWYRCLSDLVRIYNQIQERHIPDPASYNNNSDAATLASSRSSVSVSSSSTIPASAQQGHAEDNGRTTVSSSRGPDAHATKHQTQDQTTQSKPSQQQQQDAIYPLCCKAHSLVFSTSLYAGTTPSTTAAGCSIPSSLLSASWIVNSRYTLFGLRTKLRQTMADLQRAYRQFQWTLATFGLDRSSSSSLDLYYRTVQPAFRPDKLTFCNVAAVNKQQEEPVPYSTLASTDAKTLVGSDASWSSSCSLAAPPHQGPKKKDRRELRRPLQRGEDKVAEEDAESRSSATTYATKVEDDDDDDVVEDTAEEDDENEEAAKARRGSVDTAILNSSSNNNNNSHRLSEEELLIRRRYLIEDAVWRDNLMKQELLGLCHIACGLFTVDTTTSHDHGAAIAAAGGTRPALRQKPSTLMSLLRQGSPWRKGVWREGEWRASAINWDHAGLSNKGSGVSSPAYSTSSTATSPSSSQDWTPREAQAEQGEWQRICLAAIQFLVREDLAWGGNKANEELSLLKVTNYGSAWVYHE